MTTKKRLVPSNTPTPTSSSEENSFNIHNLPQQPHQCNHLGDNNHVNNNHHHVMSTQSSSHPNNNSASNNSSNHHPNNNAPPDNPSATWGTKVNRKYRQLRKTLKTCKHFEDNYFVLELNSNNPQPSSSHTLDNTEHSKPMSQSPSSQKTRRKKSPHEQHQQPPLGPGATTSPVDMLTLHSTAPPKKSALLPYQGQVQFMSEFSVVRPCEEEVVPLSIINRSEEMEQRNKRTPNSSTSGSTSSITLADTTELKSSKKRKTKEEDSKHGQPLKKRDSKKSAVITMSNSQYASTQSQEKSACSASVDIMNDTYMNPIIMQSNFSSHESSMISIPSSLPNSQHHAVSPTQTYLPSHNNSNRTNEQFLMVSSEQTNSSPHPTTSSITTKITVNPNHNSTKITVNPNLDLVSFSPQHSPGLPLTGSSSSNTISSLPSLTSLPSSSMAELAPLVTERTTSDLDPSENKLPSLNSFDNYSFFKADLTDDSMFKATRNSQERLLQRNNSTISDFLRLEDIHATPSSNSFHVMEVNSKQEEGLKLGQERPSVDSFSNVTNTGQGFSSSNCLLKRNPSGGLPRSMSHGSLSMLDTANDEEADTNTNRMETSDERSSNFSRSTSSDSMRPVPRMTILQPHFHEMQTTDETTHPRTNIEPITTTVSTISPSLTKEVVIERDKILVKSPFITPLNSVLYKNISVSNMDLVKMDVPSIDTFKKSGMASPEKDHSHWLQQIQTLPSNDSLTRIPSIDFDLGPAEKK
nr:unnamed protein product [Naegleria fowleri]